MGHSMAMQRDTYDRRVALPGWCLCQMLGLSTVSRELCVLPSRRPVACMHRRTKAAKVEPAVELLASINLQAAEQQMQKAAAA